MTITMFRAKLHGLRVTQAELYYEGSITIDGELLDASGILPYEKVQVVNVNNGARLETYTIPGERGSRIICMNGPAARLAAEGDKIIVIAYAQLTLEKARRHRPKVVIIDDNNDPKETIELEMSSEKPNLPDEFSFDILSA